MPIISSFASSSSKGFGGLIKFGPTLSEINWSMSSPSWDASGVLGSNGSIPILVDPNNGNFVLRNTGYTSINTNTYRLSDISSSTNFSSAASYPVSYEAHSGGFIGNKFYFIGGYSDAYWSTGQSAMYSYSYSSNSYSSEPSSPAANAQNKATSMNSTKFWLGMGHKFSNTNSFYEFNGSSWTSRASLPVTTKRGNSSEYVLTGDKVVWSDSELVPNTIYIYSISSNSWNGGTSTPISNQGAGSMPGDGVNAVYYWDSSNGYKFTSSITTWSSGNAITNANGSTSYGSNWYNSKLYNANYNRRTG